MADPVPRHRHRRRPRPHPGWLVAALCAVLLLGGAAIVYTQWSPERDGCTGDPVALTVVASPDQAPVLSELAGQWPGGCATATVRAMPSHAVSSALGDSWDEQRDGPRPDVWAPDSNTWLLVTASRPDAAALLPTAAPTSLATSPVVLAMQRPMAEALGHPGRPLGWTDLLGGFAGGATWARFGHPEWGPFRLGMADPTRSTAGLAAVLSALDLDGDNTMSDQELLGGVGFAQLVTDYQPDTESLVKLFTTPGAASPGAASPGTGAQAALPAAFPVLERELAGYAATDPAVPLVPIYPKEGTVFADYPYAVLRAPWVDEARQRAAAGFLGYLTSEPGRQAYAKAGFRDPARAVPDPAVLSPARGFAATVAPPRPPPTAEGLGQLVGMWSLLQRNTNLLIALDTSGSMSRPVPTANVTRLQLLQRAAIQGIALLTNHTVVGLWQFSSRLTPSTDYRELVPVGPAGANVGPVTRRQAMIGAIQGLTAQGGTGLYDTVYASYLRMQGAWQPNAQNVLVVVTDGRNEDDIGLSLPDLLARLKAAMQPDRPLQFIGIAVGSEADAVALGEITKVTGGRTFVARDETAAVQQIVLAFAGRIS